MKKLLISLFAFVSLISCSKQDIMYDDFQQEIGFSAVASNSTKSVAGYNGNTFDGVFPTDIDLYVFANAQDAKDGVLQQTWKTPYFKNALFEWTTAKNETEIDNIAQGGSYAGNPTRYWPNVKSLKFAGYSSAYVFDINAETLPSMNTDFTELTLPAYFQDNGKSDEGANDLMWFITTNSYTKQANEVHVQMKHACSWITINVYGDDVTATYPIGEGENAPTHYGWWLNSLKVKQLVHTGSVTCNLTNAIWTIDNNAERADELYYDDNTRFTKTETEYATIANNFIVIPQTPTSVDVTYTYTSDATNGIALTETKNIPLTLDDATAWQSGYHYIYNIKITATEILIDPVVVDWSAYTGNTIDKDTDE